MHMIKMILRRIGQQGRSHAILALNTCSTLTPLAFGHHLLIFSADKWFSSTRIKHHTLATIKTTKNSTPHKITQCTKRELGAMTTRPQEPPITEQSLKRNDY